MKIEIRREGEEARVAPDGDIVASTVPDLRPAMRDLVRGGARQVCLDLANTGMIDSTGLGLLLSAFNSLRQVSGRFRVLNASPEILNLLQTMRINQHFEVAGR
jgi:anti-sigma B factor antagonist